MALSVFTAWDFAWIVFGTSGGSTGNISHLGVSLCIAAAELAYWIWGEQGFLPVLLIRSFMEFKVQNLQEEVADLRDELHQLRGSFNRLRRQVESDDSRVVHGLPSGAGSYSFVGEEEEASLSGSFAAPEPRDFQSPVVPLVVPAIPVVQSEQGPSAPALTWAERERICRGIAEFINRALQGVHRGISGREQLPYGSRVWLVARSYTGDDFRPVRIYTRFADCKALVKRGQDCGASVFVGLPSQREARIVAIHSGLGWPETIN